VANLFIAGISAVSVGVTARGREHSRNSLKIGFYPPKATACKIDGFLHSNSFPMKLIYNETVL